MESNIHAREWVTSATATWLLNELLTSIDPIIQALSNEYDWIIVPIVNVDGFVYTTTTVSIYAEIFFKPQLIIVFVYRIECGGKLDNRIHFSAKEQIRIEILISIGYVGVPTDARVSFNHILISR